MSDLPNPIFISYSHKDAKLVRPIVLLLRATKDLVFQDIDSIRAGRKWRPQIGKALIEAKLIVLFWCRHSVRSKEVKKEYRHALESRKDILPILLDKTELPDELGEFEWVDFRKISRYNHGSHWAWIKTTLISLGVLFLGLSVTVITLANRSCGLPEAGGLRGNRFEEFLVLLLIMALAIFGISSYFFVRYRRRKKSSRHMAQSMYEEIIKRKHENLTRE